MIVGTEAVTRHMTTEAYEHAQEPKRLHWIDGATHVDLYDREQHVGPAIDALTDFYTTGLRVSRV